MAAGFNLTAQLNLKGPNNVSVIVADIKKQLGTINASVNLTVAPAATTNINKLNAALLTFNKTLSATSSNAATTAAAIRNLGTAIGSINSSNLPQVLSNSANASAKLAQASTNNARQLRAATNEMTEFGRQAGLAFRRFSAITSVTSVIYGLTNAINNGIRAYIDYDRELVKLQQVTGQSAAGLKNLEGTITSLATGLGVGSAELTQISSTLAQAGLSARDTEKALKALALSSLAPSFDSMNETVEGSIALMRQFGINAGDLEKALGSVNSVAAKFAVEAADLITAIQRTGGVFATASKGVSEGTDALNEFLAVFTSIRATTRESAETIATGLRTIFTRIQRGDTIQALKEYGVNLQDLDGKFVGAYKAVELLSKGLGGLDPRDLRFSKIVEELGGFRQIGKVIPLIQQFATAQDALKVAQTGQGSLAADAAKAQESLAVQISKVREQFLALFRDIGKSDSFQAIAKGALSVTSALIKAADSIKGILPVLGVMLAFKGASAAVQFGSGFLSGIRGAGGPKALGNRMGGGPGMSSGGSVRRFASGGLVPGSGDTDSIDAKLMPGEFVMSKPAVKAIGSQNLHRMNKYAEGGKVGPIQIKTLPQAVSLISQNPRVSQYINPKQDSASASIQQITPNMLSLDINTIAREIYNDMRKGLPISQTNQKFLLGKNKPTPVQSKSYAGLLSRRGQDFLAGKEGQRRVDELGTQRESPKWSEAYERLLSNHMKDELRIRNYIPTGEIENVPYRNSYPIDLISKNGRSIGEVKFRPSGVVSKTDYLDKLLRARVTRNITQPFTKFSPETKDIGNIEVFEMPNKSSVIEEIRRLYKKDQTNKASGGFIRKFANAGLVTPTAGTSATSSEILKVLTIQGAMQASGASAGDILKILKKKNTLNPSEKTIKDQILAAYTQKTSGIKEANDLDIEKAITDGLLFGAAGFKGKAFATTPRMDIPGLKHPVKVRITSGVLDSEMSKKLLGKMTGGLNDIANKTSRNIMIKDILKQTGPLYADFDRTLAFGADKILADPRKPKYSEFSNRDKVSGALKTAKLSALGKAIASTVKQTPSFADNLHLISARPQSTMDLIAGWLAQQGIPIPLSRIKGVGGENITAEQVAILKADLMNPEGAFVDDDDRNIAEAEKRGIRSYLYKKKRVGSTSRKKLGEANAKGYLAERVINELGGPIANKAAQNYGIDFPDGLQSAAKYFGIPSNIPTDAKLTLNGPAELKSQIGNYLKDRGYASGGSVKDDYYSLEKSSGLKSWEFDNAVKFAKTVNYSMSEFQNYIKKLQTEKQNKSGVKSDKDALLKSLMPTGSTSTAKQLALAESLKGAPDAGYRPILTQAQRIAQARSDLKGYSIGGATEAQQKKPEKQFGKISIDEDSGMVSVGYLKNNTRSGYATAYKMRDNLYYVGLSSATKGYGPRLYDTLMEAVTEKGAMLTSDRSVVSGDARKVWEYYFKNRGDVKKTPLKPSDWTLNSALLDPKLHGRAETWPPATDPAWILQSGYSKSPNLINSPDVIRSSAKPDSRAMALSYFGARTKGFAVGGSVMAMLTPGEAVLSPEKASEIGKSNLDRLNHAEKYVKRNSGGGISIVPGSGDGDTYGPVPLAVGSYVIRKKATAALGLARNSGGPIGYVQNFADGGTPMPLRPDVISRATVKVDDKALEALKKLEQMITQLGIASSRTAQLILTTKDISYKAAEKAMKADLDRIKISGASIDKIVQAENALKTVREQRNQDVNKRKTLESAFSSGFDGKSSSEIQMGIAESANERTSKAVSVIEKSRSNKAEKDLITDKKTKDYDKTRADLIRANPLGYIGDIEKEASSRVMKRSAAGKYDLTESERKDIRSKSSVSDEERKNIYSSKTMQAMSQATGVSQSSLKKSGIGADDIRSYVQQSMMDRKTLAQMDKDLLKIRREEYRVHGTIKGMSVKSASEFENLLQQELATRRKLVTETAKAEGLSGPGMAGYTGRGTLGGAFGGIGNRVMAGIGGVRENIRTEGVLRTANKGIQSLGGLANGNAGYFASLGLGLIAGQGENIAGAFTGDKKTKSTMGAAIEGGIGTAAAGLGMASSVAGIPVVGPYLAALTLAGTAVTAFSEGIKAAGKAAREFEQNLRTKAIEDIGEKLTKSLGDLQNNPTDPTSRNKVLQDAREMSVAVNADNEMKLKDAKAEKASTQSMFSYITGGKAPTLETADIKDLAKQRARGAEPAAQAARAVIESRMQSGEKFSDISKDPGFKELSNIIAEASPEFQAAKVRIEAMSDATIAATGETRAEMIARHQEAEVLKLQSDSGLLARAKTLEAAKAMDEANKAGRQLAMTFASMSKSVEQSIGRLSFELDSMSDATDNAIDNLTGTAKIGNVRSKDANVLANPDAYDEKTKQETTKRITDAMFNPNKPGLDPLERERRQGDADNATRLLNADTGMIGRRASGAVQNVLRTNAGADLDTVASAAKKQLEEDIKDLPAEARDQIMKSFEGIKKQADSEGGADKAGYFFREIQDKLAGAVSGVKDEFTKAAIEVANFRNKAVNEFAGALNKATTALLKAEDYFNKAKDIKTESNISLREFESGGKIGLGERQQVINNRIGRLTGGETDPTKIRKNIETLSQQQEAEQKKYSTADNAKDAQKSGAALMDLNKSISRNKQALEELANSTEMAAAAMDQLQSLQKMQADRLQNLDQVLTSTPQELQKLNESLIRVQKRALGIDTGPSREAQKAYNMTLRQTGGNRRLAMMAGQAQMAQDRGMDLKTMEQYKSNFQMQYLNNNPGKSMEDAENEYKKGAANVRGQMAYESGAINIPGVRQTIMSQVDPTVDPAYKNARDKYIQANANQAQANEEMGNLEQASANRLLKDATDRLTNAFDNLSDMINGQQQKKFEDVNINVGKKMFEGDVPAAEAIPIFASTGKYINFTPKGTDTVPAMLTPGEFVINARATAQHLPLLKAINSGTNMVGNTAMMSEGGVVYLAKGGKAKTAREIFEEEFSRPVSTNPRTAAEEGAARLAAAESETPEEPQPRVTTPRNPLNTLIRGTGAESRAAPRNEIERALDTNSAQVDAQNKAISQNIEGGMGAKRLPSIPLTPQDQALAEKIQGPNVGVKNIPLAATTYWYNSEASQEAPLPTKPNPLSKAEISRLRAIKAIDPRDRNDKQKEDLIGLNARFLKENPDIANQQFINEQRNAAVLQEGESRTNSQLKKFQEDRKKNPSLTASDFAQDNKLSPKDKEKIEKTVRDSDAISFKAKVDAEVAASARKSAESFEQSPENQAYLKSKAAADEARLATQAADKKYSDTVANNAKAEAQAKVAENAARDQHNASVMAKHREEDNQALALASGTSPYQYKPEGSDKTLFQESRESWLEIGRKKGKTESELENYATQQAHQEMDKKIRKSDEIVDDMKTGRRGLPSDLKFGSDEELMAARDKARANYLERPSNDPRFAAVESYREGVSRFKETRKKLEREDNALQSQLAGIEQAEKDSGYFGALGRTLDQASREANVAFGGDPSQLKDAGQQYREIITKKREEIASTLKSTSSGLRPSPEQIASLDKTAGNITRANPAFQQIAEAQEKSYDVTSGRVIDAGILAASAVTGGTAGSLRAAATAGGAMGFAEETGRAALQSYNGTETRTAGQIAMDVGIGTTFGAVGGGLGNLVTPGAVRSGAATLNQNLTGGILDAIDNPGAVVRTAKDKLAGAGRSILQAPEAVISRIDNALGRGASQTAEAATESASRATRASSLGMSTSDVLGQARFSARFNNFNTSADDIVESATDRFIKNARRDAMERPDAYAGRSLRNGLRSNIRAHTAQANKAFPSGTLARSAGKAGRSQAGDVVRRRVDKEVKEKLAEKFKTEIRDKYRDQYAAATTKIERLRIQDLANKELADSLSSSNIGSRYAMNVDMSNQIDPSTGLRYGAKPPKPALPKPAPLGPAVTDPKTLARLGVIDPKTGLRYGAVSPAAPPVPAPPISARQQAVVDTVVQNQPATTSTISSKFKAPAARSYSPISGSDLSRLTNGKNIIGIGNDQVFSSGGKLFVKDSSSGRMIRLIEDENSFHKMGQQAITSKKYSTGGIVYASNGAFISTLSRGSDTVPAMLTPGEFVVNRQAARQHMPVLRAINSGAYSQGGAVKYLAAGGLADDDSRFLARYLEDNGYAKLRGVSSAPQVASTVQSNPLAGMDMSVVSQLAGALVELKDTFGSVENIRSLGDSLQSAVNTMGNNVNAFGEHISNIPGQVMHNMSATVTQHVTGLGDAGRDILSQATSNANIISQNNVSTVVRNLHTNSEGAITGGNPDGPMGRVGHMA